MSAFSVMILCLSSSKFKNLKDVYDFFSDSYYHIRFYFRGGIYFVDFDFSNFHVHILADGHVREPNQKFWWYKLSRMASNLQIPQKLKHKQYYTKAM